MKLAYLIFFIISTSSFGQGLRIDDIKTSALIKPPSADLKVLPVTSSTLRLLLEQANGTYEAGKKQLQELKPVFDRHKKDLNEYSIRTFHQQDEPVNPYTIAYNGSLIKINFSGYYPERGELEWSIFRNGEHINTFTVDLANGQILRAGTARLDTSWRDGRLVQAFSISDDKSTGTFITLDDNGAITSLATVEEPFANWTGF